MVKFKNGKIVTDLDDIDFIELVWLRWAGYEESDFDYLRAGLQEGLSEGSFRKEGVLVVENAFFVQPDYVVLKKVGEGQWMIEGADHFEVEDFVERFQDEE